MKKKELCLVISLFSLLFITVSSVSATPVTDTIGTTNHVDDGISANQAQACPVVASASGTLTSVGINIRTDNAGYIRLGIYSDSAGAPHDLLEETSNTSVTAGWMDISIGSIDIVEGTTYWVAYLGNVTTDLYYAPGLHFYYTKTFGAFDSSWAGSLEANNTGRMWNMRIIYESATNATYIDSFTSDAHGTTNFGTANNLTVSTNNSDFRKAFLMWNMSELIDENQTLVSAKIYLYALSVPTYAIFNQTNITEVRSYRAYNTTLAWRENNITYNTQPDQSVLQDNITAPLTAGNWMVFDVTEAAKSAYNSTSNQNMSIVIRHDIVCSDYYNVTPYFCRDATLLVFASKDYPIEAYRPYISVIYSSISGITNTFLMGFVTLLSDTKGVVMLSLTAMTYGITYFTRHEELVMYVFTVLVFVLSLLSIIPQGIGMVIALNSLCMAIAMSRGSRIAEASD